jgi:hypothetical protein
VCAQTTTLEEGPPTIGDGGCVAHVIAALDVFPSVKEAMQKLNAQISIVKLKFRTDQQVPGFIGIPNDRWHPEVVKAAVVNEGFHFRKLNLAKVDLREEVKWGDLMFDGVLNDTYVRRWVKDDKHLDPEWVEDDVNLSKGYIRLRTDPDDKTTAANNEAGWRHAIAVRNRKIVDKEVEMSAAYLWLGDDNRPDVNRSYFRKIYKVYRIFKCATGKVGCKGECGGSPNPTAGLATTPPVAVGTISLEDYRVRSGLDIFVVPNFATTVLKMDPAAFLHALEKYPVRGKGDAIVPNIVQWVDGTNAALNYRGHELMRRKIWMQRGDPKDGYLRYGYTGWQWNVLPATVDVAICPETLPIVDAYDEWATSLGHSSSNHYIVTGYEDGQHNIGFHSDKAKDIVPGSLITVVKLGSHARPFELCFPGKEKEPFFSKVLQPGTAIIMTLEANLATKHGVPVVSECGPSGSIVFRTIATKVPLPK